MGKEKGTIYELTAELLQGRGLEDDPRVIAATERALELRERIARVRTEALAARDRLQAALFGADDQERDRLRAEIAAHEAEAIAAERAIVEADGQLSQVREAVRREIHERLRRGNGELARDLVQALVRARAINEQVDHLRQAAESVGLNLPIVGFSPLGERFEDWCQLLQQEGHSAAA